jgi:formylglycine-generating enzyme required for sulfatase activity
MDGMLMKRKAIVFVLLLGCSVGAEDLMIQSFDATGALTFNEIPNATSYGVQQQSAGEWTSLFDFSAAGSGMATATVSMADPAMLYRVAATVTNPPAPPGMVFIPAGSFQMGDNFSERGSNELPVHTVYVSAFYMDRYEVTNDEMVRVLNWAYGQGKLTVSASSVRNAEGNSQELVDLDDSNCRISWNGSQFVMKATNGSGYPCVEVTWYGAVAYCNYRTQMEGGGRTSCYNLSDWSGNWSATGYRLPTEAEWEKAARGGLSGQRFPWGATIQHARANYYSDSSSTYDTSPTRGYHPNWVDGGWPYTSPVGAFAPNGYWLYDMAGNVWEWCGDWYSSGYYEVSPGTDPRGPASGSYRVYRGGSWIDNAGYCRVASRDRSNTGLSGGHAGFRAVLPPGQW